MSRRRALGYSNLNIARLKTGAFLGIPALAVGFLAFAGQAQKFEWTGKVLNIRAGRHRLQRAQTPGHPEGGSAARIHGDLIYTYYVDEDQGLEYVQRFRIKNYAGLPVK